MDDIQAMAARAAVKNMLGNGYISICDVDKILKMSGGVPSSYDYQILHTLHCVKFMDMEPELLRGLPVILQRVLNASTIQFQFEFKESARKIMLLKD